MVKASKNLSTEILIKVIIKSVNPMVEENIHGMKVAVIKGNLDQVYVLEKVN
jgi:hypothetical protein